MNPWPPASTTPASLSTGRRSGVWRTASRAASTERSRTPLSVASPAARAASAASAVARTTVRIVPSTGRMTAWYAASAAVRSPVVRSRTSTASRPRKVSARPRRICDRITPLLPRAPIKRAVRHRHAHVVHSGRGAELLAHRLEGEGHVGAGVAIGHRVDVEAVQLLLVCPRARRGRSRPPGRPRTRRVWRAQPLRGIVAVDGPPTPQHIPSLSRALFRVLSRPGAGVCVCARLRAAAAPLLTCSGSRGSGFDQFLPASS